MSTLTWGSIPSINEINHQVEIGKEVSPQNLLELTTFKDEKTLVWQLATILKDLEQSVVDDWDSLSEKTRKSLENAAISYFSKSSEVSKSRKLSFKKILTRILIRAYVYSSFLKALFADRLEQLYDDYSFLIEAQSSLMHAVLDVVEESDGSGMSDFLEFLEKDCKDGSTKHCIPYTQEMSARYHRLIEGVEAD